MKNKLLITACICAILAVGLGAFGAHSLKDSLEPAQLQTFETGIRYQFYHVFAMFIAGVLNVFRPNFFFRAAGSSFLAGIILFSGSLYLLSTRSLLGIESWTWLGPLTPIGGLLFMVGWGLLAYGLFLKNKVIELE